MHWFWKRPRAPFEGRIRCLMCGNEHVYQVWQPQQSGMLRHCNHCDYSWLAFEDGSIREATIAAHP